MTCKHEDFEAHVDVVRLTDSGRFCADIRIHCLQCKQPFRFIGAPAGYSPDSPTVNVDGTMLNAPIEPEIVKMLAGNLRYDFS